jgi:hypothetical protein
MNKMKITKPSGEVIECTIEEYTQLIKSEQKQNRTEFINEYKDSVNEELDKPKKVSTKKVSDKEHKRNYMREYMKTYRPTSNKVHKKYVKHYVKNSFKRWKKSEDKIVLNFKIRKAMKLLGRSYHSIKTRLKYIRHNKVTYGKRKVNLNDKRVPMMKFVSHKTRDIQKENPKLTRLECQRLAFQLYRNKNHISTPKHSTFSNLFSTK